MELHAQETKALDPSDITLNSSSSPLNNGVYYEKQRDLSNGTAYFNELNYFTVGTVTYDSINFTDVLLMYDLVSDLIVTSTFNGSYVFSLIPDKVSNFQLNGHYFVNLIAPEKSSLRSGFYELIYDKDLKVFLKRKKIFKEVIDKTTIIQSYISSSNYYLKKDNVYYEITGKNSFLNLFKDRKKELKRFIKENGLKFNDNPTQAIIAMANFCDSLSK